MKKASPTVLKLCFLFACASFSFATSASDNSGNLYIDDLHILDIESGKILKNRQLHIRDGKVVAIKPAQTPITDAQFRLHDGKGQYLIPGLIDMHVHAYDSAAFVITLSHGVTHLRLMNGVKEQLIWREELQTNRRIGSTITVSSPIISGFETPNMHQSAQTVDQVVGAVRRAKQLGYDLIKAYGNLTEPVLTAMLHEAKNQNIPVAKHGPHPSGDMQWNELVGIQSLEHVEDIYQGPLDYQQDQQKLDKTIAQLKKLNAPITSTLNIFWQLTQISEHKQAYLDSQPENYTSPIITLEEKRHQVRRWLNSAEGMVEHNKKTFAYLQNIARQLYEAKLTLLIGSDSGVLLSPHGIATHNEMELLQQAGLPNLAILQAATINAAKTLGKESELGKVAPGFIADFILVETNPLENLAALKNPDWVIKHGQLFSGIELEKLRNEAIDNRSFWQELRILSSAGD
jgi:imidazolonepropionase-like amidohydrolase